MPPIKNRKPAPTVAGLGHDNHEQGLGLGDLPRQANSWEKKRVALRLVDRWGNRSVIHPAVDVLGAWCVHPALGDKDGRPRPGWTVSHAPTGLRLATLDTEQDARRMATRLHELTRGNDVFSQEDRGAIGESLPENVRQWVLACRRERRWEDPMQGGIRRLSDAAAK